MISVATISKQGGRRYRQFGSTPSIGASPLSLVGTTSSLIYGLIHSPAFIIRTLLTQQGLATEPSINQAWPAFASREPDLPDNAITCYNTSGKVEGQTNTDNEVQEHYGVQVRVRAATPDVCFTKIKSVTNYLDQNVIDMTVAVNASIYLIHAISRTGGIFDLGNEVASTKRTIMTVNTFVSVVQLS